MRIPDLASVLVACGLGLGSPGLASPIDGFRFESDVSALEGLLDDPTSDIETDARAPETIDSLKQRGIFLPSLGVRLVAADGATQDLNFYRWAKGDFELFRVVVPLEGRTADPEGAGSQSIVLVDKGQRRWWRVAGWSMHQEDVHPVPILFRDLGILVDPLAQGLGYPYFVQLGKGAPVRLELDIRAAEDLMGEQAGIQTVAPEPDSLDTGTWIETRWMADGLKLARGRGGLQLQAKVELEQRGAWSADPYGQWAVHLHFEGAKPKLLSMKRTKAP